MNGEQYPSQVTASQLARDAYLYVRHATPRQGLTNAETIRRQDQLRQQAVVWGWPSERVIVIDSDVGQPATSQTPRLGFQRLVRQIELGCAGLVMALEPSRWARNLTDWQRLLEACARSETLLLDQHGLYDPADVHDRLLLGCDQTLSRTTELYPLRKETVT